MLFERLESLRPADAVFLPPSMFFTSSFSGGVSSLLNKFFEKKSKICDPIIEKYRLHFLNLFLKWIELELDNGLGFKPKTGVFSFFYQTGNRNSGFKTWVGELYIE